MGIIASYFGGNSHSNEPDPVTGLTPKEKQLIENTWIVVKKDILGFGVELFITFFRNGPEYQNFFAFKGVPLDELSKSPKLKGHAINVMYALSAIVDNLNNNDVLINLLEKNGETHAKRCIPAKAYWDLKVNFIELLHNRLGSKMTKDMKDAWDKTLTVAFTVITKTAEKHYPQK